MLDFLSFYALDNDSFARGSILNVWSASYLCLLAQYLKLPRYNLVNVLSEYKDYRPQKNEKMADWALRFTISILTYYENEFMHLTGTFSKLNLCYSKQKTTDNAKSLLNCIAKEIANVELEKSSFDQIKIMLNFEARFPKLLREIQAKPALLFYIGDERHLQYNYLPTIALVGSRKMTNYGATVIEQIVSNLSLYRINIVSGLAYGCDISAHRLSLAYGALPIAVLPNGLARCYPTMHKADLSKIEEAGVAISEFLPWQQAKPAYFAARNRLISGLSQLVVIIEAAQKSGSLITASFALDQGREVLAVPGTITQAYSVGCNRLILDGCQPYLAPDQIINVLNAKNSVYPLILKEQTDTVRINKKNKLIYADNPPSLVTNEANHAKLATLICQILEDNVSMLSQDLFACLNEMRRQATLPEIELGEFLTTLELLELSGKVKKQRMQYFLANK